MCVHKCMFVCFTLTLQTYWLRAPGENVCERDSVLVRRKGGPCPYRPGLSLGCIRISSVLVALST